MSLAGGILFFRDELVKIFSWAVPTPNCLAWMVSTSPRIVEIGSGQGYWAAMLSKFGADVVAVDSAPGSGKWHATEQLTGLEYLQRHDGCPDRALFLCWPHFLVGNEGRLFLRSFQKATGEIASDSAEEEDEFDHIGECIDAYRGEWIFYVGEESGGCTYDIENRLDVQKGTAHGWERVQTLKIPNWKGIHDRFVAYKRNK